MPYRSDAQRRWAHTAAGKKALGGAAKVREWDQESRGMSLPRKVIHSAAAAVHAMKAKGGKPEVAAQRKAMSQSKRVRFRKAKGY